MLSAFYCDLPEPMKSVYKWISILLACLCLVLAFNYALLDLHVNFAAGQVSVFQNILVSAEASKSPAQLTGMLGYVLSYYPSGARQTPGSHVDNIVETARSNVVAIIIHRLQKITERDLGKDPSIWLKAYPPNQE